MLPSESGPFGLPEILTVARVGDTASLHRLLSVAALSLLFCPLERGSGLGPLLLQVLRVRYQ